MLSAATKTAAGVTKGLAENDVKTSAREAIKTVEREAKHVLDDVSHYASDAGQKVRHLYDQAVDEVSHVSHNVESEIKSNPVRASMVALGVGFILGALLTRR
ncbi:hypothetical protein [Asticcacaulis machinosus]|uniref:Membrane-anchored ribosome-binding protein, inhibits growth in stationary phase, ElaB/YqjD/DUF883 family n=1 Tax=Asticcacaulis machinosus TaxID=2984211 RepID=A0ABT5HKD6_9CAUL|nr:hypothetical protein [Asticcacaulis machinosus]MDC7676701.1 hypothetical protein [Asticcacaulis machinosus]